MEASERRMGVLKILALAITLIQGRIHGYELCRRISELSGGKWSPSIGTVYRVLNDLAKEGYLSRSEEGRGERQVVTYRLTPKGAEFLASTVPCILRKNYLGMKIVVEAYLKMIEHGLAEIRASEEDIKYLEELEKLISKLKNSLKERRH